MLFVPTTDVHVVVQGGKWAVIDGGCCMASLSIILCCDLDTRTFYVVIYSLPSEQIRVVRSDAECIRLHTDAPLHVSLMSIVSSDHISSISQSVGYMHPHHLLRISRVNRKWVMHSTSYILDLHTSRLRC